MTGTIGVSGKRLCAGLPSRTWQNKEMPWSEILLLLRPPSPKSPIFPLSCKQANKRKSLSSKGSPGGMGGSDRYLLPPSSAGQVQRHPAVNCVFFSPISSRLCHHYPLHPGETQDDGMDRTMNIKFPTYTNRIQSCQSHMLREHLGFCMSSMCVAPVTEFHRGHLGCRALWQVPSHHHGS